MATSRTLIEWALPQESWRKRQKGHIVHTP